MHTLRWLRRVRPDLPVLVLATSDDPNQKLEAIRLGAQDYLVRPLQPQQLETAIRRSLFYYTESSESEIVADEIEQIGDDMFFVAASPTMRKLRAQAELLAQVSAPVLILGENGSGKELAARLIHKLSVRSGFRFLKINCATLPGDVLESELFGVANGNGRTKPGKLELCQRGTLFLDEITEMPMSLQAKLLHVLQDGYFVRVRAATAGSRWMCASWRPRRSTSNRPLPTRKLREDLYYRLSAFTVHVPALRQRKEEIPLLLGHFMNQLARRYSLPARIFSAAALDACQRHSWPGNLRELEKFVKRYLVDGRWAARPGRHSTRTATWRSGTRICRRARRPALALDIGRAAVRHLRPEIAGAERQGRGRAQCHRHRARAGPLEPQSGGPAAESQLPDFAVQDRAIPHDSPRRPVVWLRQRQRRNQGTQRLPKRVGSLANGASRTDIPE